MNKTMKLAIGGGVAALMAATAMATDINVGWDATAMPPTLADGKLAFSYEGDKIASIVATPEAGERIVVTGDTMSLAESASITTGGAVTFKNALSGASALTCAPVSDDSTISVKSDDIWDLDGQPDTKWTLIFPDKNLDEYEPVSATGVEGYYNPLENAFTAYYVTRSKDDENRSVVEFQLQCGNSNKSDGTYLKYLLIKLRKGDEGIEAVITDAGYFKQLPKSAEGEDVEYMREHPDEWTYVHYTPRRPGGDKKGYAMDNLTMKRISGFPEVRFKNAANGSEGNPLTIVTCSGVKARVDGPNAIYPEFSGQGFDNGGVFEIANRGLLYTNNLGFAKSSGTIRAWRDDGDSSTMTHFDEYLTTSWTPIADGLPLDQITNVVGKINGAWIGTNDKDSECRMYNYKVVPAGHVATGQVQSVLSSTKYLRCIVVAFRCNGTRIEMKGVRGYAGTKETSGNPDSKLGFDFIKAIESGASYAEQTFATSATDIAYGIHDFDVMFDAPKPQYVRLNPTADKFELAEGSTIEVGASEGSGPMMYEIGRTTSLPTNGVLDVFSGGIALLRPQPAIGNPANEVFAGDSCLMRVHAGGKICQCVNYSWSIGPDQQVDLCGGELVFGKYFGSSSQPDAACYMNYLTLRDGATMTGRPIRVGNERDAVWKVRGKSPSTCDVGLRVTGKSKNMLGKIEFDVWDVTDNEDGDFYLNGFFRVYELDATHTNVLTRKTGAGTLVQTKADAEGQGYRAPTEVHCGTWKFGVSDIGTSKSNFTLCGGSVETAADAVNDLGVLRVTSDQGAIRVGKGGALKFADSSAATWEADLKSVLVDADLAANAVRFGTNADGLTGVQLRMLRSRNGKRVTLDENGWLREYDGGIVLIFR